MKLGGRWHERIRGIYGAPGQGRRVRPRLGIFPPVPGGGLRRGLGECLRDGGAGGRAFAGCGHLQGAVGSDAVRLYALIRDRMLAS